mgnify:CR=1 FL=1
MTRGRMLALAGVLAMTTGCSPFQASGPAPREYLLSAPAGGVDESSLRGLPAALAVARPTVPPGLDGTRIRIRRPDQRLDYIAEARWAEPLPDLIAHVQRDLLRASGRRVAQAGTESGNGDAVLELRMERFHPVYSDDLEAPPRLEVGLSLTLVDASTGRAIARARAEAATRAQANRTGTIVSGLQRLLQKTLLDGLSQLARTADRRRSPTRRAG